MPETITIKSVPDSASWKEGDEIALTATIEGTADTTATTTVTWATSDQAIASLPTDLDTTVDEGTKTATITATAKVAGSVTFTANGNGVPKPAEASLSGNINAVEPPATYDVRINSDSGSYWSAELKFAAKSFYVIVSDDSYDPVSGASVAVYPTDPTSGVTVTLLNSAAVTNDESGMVVALVKFDGVADGDYLDLTFDVTFMGTIVASQQLALQFIAPSLPAPYYPLAIDAMIDDADIAAGVYANISTTTQQSGNSLYLHVDDDIIAHPVTDADIIAENISISVNEAYLNNAHKKSFYYSMDVHQNTSFSNVTLFTVKRNDDTTGVVDLNALQVLQGDDGYINKFESDRGITVSIYDLALENTYPSGSNVFTLVCKGYGSDDTLLVNEIIPDIPVGDMSDGPFEITDDGKLRENVFNKIGTGYVIMTYSAFLDDGDGKGTKHSSEPVRYNVDVIPPGGRR